MMRSPRRHARQEEQIEKDKGDGLGDPAGGTSAARQPAALGGSDPDLQDVPRWRVAVIGSR